MKARKSGAATFRGLAIGVLVLVALGCLPLAQSSRSQSGNGSQAASPPGREPVSEVGLSQATAYPLGITTDGAGNVWFAEDNVDSIVEFSPSSSSFRMFAIPTIHHLAWIWFLLFDSEGNLWFSDESQQCLWRFDPSTSAFANFSAGGAYPFALTYDAPKDRVWFTSIRTEQVGYFRLSGGDARLGSVLNVTAPSPGAGVAGIVTDRAGNVYVAESFQAKIVELDGETLSTTRVWSLAKGSEPVGLAYDPAGGRLWFTDHASSFFGYVGLASSAVAEFSTSLLFLGGTYSVTLPYWIEVAASGEVWFNEHIGNRIARFDPSSLQLTEFEVPTNASSPLRFALEDSRGTVWFTEFSGNSIAMLPMNASEGEAAATSVRTVVLAPSATLSATPSPPSSTLTVSLNYTSTGEPGPGFSVTETAAGGSFRVQMSAQRAEAGNYSAAVCFAYPETNQCGYVLVVVPKASSFPIVIGVYLAIGAGLAVLLIALRREYLAERRRRLPAGFLDRLARTQPAAPKAAATTRATARIRSIG